MKGFKPSAQMNLDRLRILTLAMKEHFVKARSERMKIIFIDEAVFSP